MSPEKLSGLSVRSLVSLYIGEAREQVRQAVQDFKIDWADLKSYWDFRRVALAKADEHPEFWYGENWQPGQATVGEVWFTARRGWQLRLPLGAHSARGERALMARPEGATQPKDEQIDRVRFDADTVRFWKDRGFQ